MTKIGLYHVVKAVTMQLPGCKIVKYGSRVPRPSKTRQKSCLELVKSGRRERQFPRRRATDSTELFEQIVTNDEPEGRLPSSYAFCLTPCFCAAYNRLFPEISQVPQNICRLTKSIGLEIPPTGKDFRLPQAAA